MTAVETGGQIPGAGEFIPSGALNLLQTERRLQLEYAVVRVLAESASLPEGLPNLLQAVCVYGGWEFGELWLLEEGSGGMTRHGSWAAPKLRDSKLEESRAGIKAQQTAGFAGRVVVERKGVWIRDLQEDRDASNPASFLQGMAAAGLRTAAGFPIWERGRVTGVIALACARDRTPDPDILELLNSVGRQIGEFVRRRRAEETIERNERRFRSLVEHSHDIIAVVEFSGIIVYASPSMDRILGYAPSEAGGRNIFELIHPDDRRTAMKHLHSLPQPEGLASKAEFRMRRRDGSWRWMESVATNLLGDDAVRAVVVNARDVTAHRESEEKVRALNEGLEHLVRVRTAQLEAANRELESFSYSVAHDLRAPVRGIDGFARMLDEQYSEALDEEGERLLGIIRKSARRMGELIDDLLAFSRISRQEPETTSTVDMEAQVAIVLADLLKSHPSPETEVKVGSLPMVRGNPSMIRQIWTNLIENAMKFSRKNPRPVIEIGSDESRGEVVFHVRDNGIGFDARHADRLFGVFQRLHADAQFEGTGVGLAIVQRLVQKHGGRVWADAEPGRGATFYFTIPGEETQ